MTFRREVHAFNRRGLASIATAVSYQLPWYSILRCRLHPTMICLRRYNVDTSQSSCTRGSVGSGSDKSAARSYLAIRCVLGIMRLEASCLGPPVLAWLL